MMKRLNVLTQTGLVTAGVLTTGLCLSLAKPDAKAKNTDKSKPNIIFILADDLGFAEIGCNGADRYKTPNIDRLASLGVRFTNAYTAPLSGPSRATILTGRHAYHSSATNQDAVGRLDPAKETLIPTYLKEAGYASAMIGKWSQFPLEPSDWGFDYNLRFQGSGVYWNRQKKGKTYTLNGNLTTLQDNEYLPDVMHDRLVDFITENHDRPFYVHYSMSHVHTEIMPTPLSKADVTNEDMYYDNITYMDKLVGRLMDELDRQKLSDNTIIVFFGDNGTAGGRADAATIGGRRIIGQKGSMLEGGSLVPMIVYWPGVTKGATVSNNLISSVDFLPTFTDIADVSIPKDKLIDGQSFKEQLQGKNVTPRSSIFVQLANMFYVRNSSYKLTEKGELFDMSKAPFEEILVAVDTKDPKAIAARKSLQAELDRLNPKGGFIDTGDGTGRHANKAKNKFEEGE